MLVRVFAALGIGTGMRWFYCVGSVDIATACRKHSWIAGGKEDGSVHARTDTATALQQ